MHREEMREELHKMECPTHHQKPVVIIQNNQIQVSTCCTPFRKEVLQHLRELKEKFKTG